MAVKGWKTRVLRWKGSWSEPVLLEEEFVAYTHVFVEDPRGNVSIVSMGWNDGDDAVWLFREDESSGGWTGPDSLFPVEDLNSMGISAAFGPGGRLFVVYGRSGEDKISGDFYFLAKEL